MEIWPLSGPTLQTSVFLSPHREYFAVINLFHTKINVSISPLHQCDTTVSVENKLSQAINIYNIQYHKSVHSNLS